ncbi:MAG TPA: anti-sigma factor [Candidatus Baltobacteraceae bacterium]|nr:anti-sigma factor [Candidatus Baltobacteraceae bacterium]
MTDAHDDMLDDVAVYALGALAAPEAARVRAHIANCAQCKAEYDALAPAALAIAHDAPEAEPSALLRARIMRGVRAEASAKPKAASRPLVWPAYLVAAACFAIAVVSSLANLSLMEQLKSAQTQVALTERNTSGLARNLADEKTMVTDLEDTNAQRYNVGDGQIVRVGDRLYVTLHDLASPPHGKVYQAWTLPKGAKAMAPSVTFVPNSHGVAVIALGVDARITDAVAVSIEPEGGSKAPTTKPLLVQTLN